MHIVVIAWLFLTSTMALTLSAVAGIVFFCVVGLAPVALYAWLAVRRRAHARARGRPTTAEDERAGGASAPGRSAPRR